MRESDMQQITGGILLAQYLKKKKRGKLWLTLAVIAVVSFVLGYWYSAGHLGT
jgi:hypothetical protein